MKRYLSVFEMIARSSIYKVLAVLAAMAVAELGTFYIAMQQPLARIQPNLEEIIDQSHYVWILGTAYILVTVVLVLQGCNIGSIQSYTLQRLRISEKKVFTLQSIYNILCYGLLWVAQLAVLLVSAGYYMEHQTHAVLSNQTVFLAFHRNALMHSILPLEDVLGWCVLVYIIVGTGISAAAFTWQQRRGKIGWALIVVVALVLFTFPRKLGSGLELILVSAIIALVQPFYRKFLSKKEADITETQPSGTAWQHHRGKIIWALIIVVAVVLIIPIIFPIGLSIGLLLVLVSVIIASVLFFYWKFLSKKEADNTESGNKASTSNTYGGGGGET